MHTVYCSGKLADVIGRSKLVRQPELSNPDKIFKWNAQLFFNDRKKCLLLTNKATLYSIVCWNFTKGDLHNLSAFINEALLKQLNADGLPAGNSLFNLPAEWQLALTDNDKKVIGSMNDYVYQLKVAVDYQVEGFDPPDNTRAGSNINNVPMGSIKYQSPVSCLRSHLERLS